MYVSVQRIKPLCKSLTYEILGLELPASGRFKKVPNRNVAALVKNTVKTIIILRVFCT